MSPDVDCRCICSVDSRVHRMCPKIGGDVFVASRFFRVLRRFMSMSGRWVFAKEIPIEKRRRMKEGGRKSKSVDGCVDEEREGPVLYLCCPCLFRNSKIYIYGQIQSSRVGQGHIRQADVIDVCMLVCSDPTVCLRYKQ